jgi:hypothetical protein
MACSPKYLEGIRPRIMRFDSGGEVEATFALSLGKGASAAPQGHRDGPRHHGDGAIGIVAASGLLCRFLQYGKQHPFVRRRFGDVSEGLDTLPGVRNLPRYSVRLGRIVPCDLKGAAAADHGGGR